MEQVIDLGLTNNFYKEILLNDIEKLKHECTTKCKCNAGGCGVPAVVPCSSTANPSLTDDGFKMMINKKPALLRAGLKGNRFKIPHSTYTQPLQTFKNLRIVYS